VSESIEARLKTMIVERLFMKIEPGSIEDDKSLIQHYGVDSVSLLELIVGLEEAFGIRVEDQEFNVEHFQSVAALAAFVRGKLGAA
jgi:acyl carrier protein